MLVNSYDVSWYVTSRRRGGVAASTINRELALLSAAINYVIQRHDWPIRNPVEENRLREPPGRARWLTRQEVAALLRVARQARQATYLPLAIALGIHCGLRHREITGLTWDRVDMTRRVLIMPPSAQKNRQWSEIPLSNTARAALAKRSRWRARHCPESTHVICTKQGRPVGSLKRCFRMAVDATGLEDVHIHDLRRTCGSWAVQAGRPILDVSRLLRHSDIRVTASVYAHLVPGQLADTVAALDAMGWGDDSHTGVIPGNLALSGMP